MRCPHCGNAETRVVDSRATELGDAIRRRRECLDCEKRFTTYERLEEVPLAVIKRGGEREPFDRSKLLNGLVRATVKREITLAELENLVTEVEADLRNEFKYEVLASEIGELVLDKLRRLDGVAYVRFASVYRQFQDLDEFTRELKKLQAKGHLKNTDKG